MNAIDSYHFGQIVINGEKYSSDVIIFPDRIQDTWRRSKSHEVRPGDIDAALAENPEVIIIGSGAAGLVEVLPEVKQALENKGIKLVIEPTGDACNTYNRLSRAQKVVAALHLTC